MPNWKWWYQTGSTTKKGRTTRSIWAISIATFEEHTKQNKKNFAAGSNHAADYNSGAEGNRIQLVLMFFFSFIVVTLT